jgi:hypothetical protein
MNDPDCGDVGIRAVAEIVATLSLLVGSPSALTWSVPLMAPIALGEILALRVNVSDPPFGTTPIVMVELEVGGQVAPDAAHAIELNACPGATAA